MGVKHRLEISGKLIFGRLLILAIVAGIPFSALSQDKNYTVKIGVLANRGRETCLQMWGPTAEYLTSEIPACSFEIVPLDYPEVLPAVERAEVDFILANPAFYVDLAAKYDAYRIATLENLGPAGSYDLVGGVIFCRADRKDIRGLRDLVGKGFMGVEERSFDGWIAAWRELKAHGIDPDRDFAPLQFGGTHDAVVYAVRDGTADGGTVRTNVLERMAEEGKIDLSTFRILNQRKTEGFSFLHSTRLYPEWPFAKVRHTPDTLAQQVAIALLKMPADHPAARAGKYAGWTVPHSYEPVRECLRELRLSPYQDFGKITLLGAIQQYKCWFAAVAVLFILLTITTLYRTNLNRRLRQSRSDLKNELFEGRQVEEELRKHRQDLEETVKERIAELTKINERLEQEIAERKRAENDLVYKASELERSNKELEQFAYVASHDLQEPLRMVSSYTQMLARRYKDKLDADANEFIAYAVDGANRMQTLINDLLAYSRVKTRGKPFEPTDAHAALGQAIANLDATIHESQAIIINGDLPTVMADETQLVQLFQNLLSNAIKFRREEPPRICVSAEQREYEWIFSVRDNGIGIAPEHLDRIFVIFQRLHDRGEYPGTGIGLAICKRIVEQHGGRIWVESEPDKGSTFYFSLPE